MNPRIREVVIEPGGRRAKVSGPIRWDTDEKEATFSAVIAQMGPGGMTVLATGRNGTPFKRLDESGAPKDLTWHAHVTVRSGGSLVTGNAEGWGVAAVLETSNLYECYPWQVPDLNVT